MEHMLREIKLPVFLTGNQTLYHFLEGYLMAFHQHLSNALDKYMLWLEDGDPVELSEFEGESRESGLQFTQALLINRNLGLNIPLVSDKTIWKLPSRR
jgi:hypothetical protein